jgi:transposase
MSAKRLSMRKIKEVLRLKWECGLKNRQIARSCSVGRATVAEYLMRAKQARLGWPLPAELDEAELDRRLFPPHSSISKGTRPMPDWLWVHQEMQKRGVTLGLLWQEYIAAHPDGYHYSWFCQRYQIWSKSLDVVMRQTHRAGEKMFVDYAGHTVEITEPNTGEIRQAQIFVAVLGASNYTYCEATWSQSLPDWIASHRRALEFFEGVPQLIIPDNIKSAVTKACRYEPDLNPTFHDMATHYGFAVIPARVRTPRDKAKAEVAVQIVERWILARLRNLTFFSLDELNKTIGKLLHALNEQPFQKLPGSRRSLFESLDRPALRPLPAQPYQYAEWKKAKVHPDYHVEVDGHYYSVPYQLVKRHVDIRTTSSTVEIFHRGNRVASHLRCFTRGRHTTISEHMPQAHRHYAQWSPERLVRWAAKTGPSTAQVIETILSSRPHPQQGFRSCLGIMRLAKQYTDQRLEAACARAMAIRALSFKSIQAILSSGQDSLPLPPPIPEPPRIHHANIRGAHYYGKQEEPAC